MKMTAVKLQLINWQGVTETYELSKLMDVNGPNGKGKTRFKNAFSWIISGRDSNGKAQFDIKDFKNPQLRRDNHTVIIDYLMHDGKGLTLQKDFVEVWTTDKGSEKEYLKGHKTNYWINGNSKSKGDYEEYISALIPVDLLQILSDPLFFPNMDWTKQRAILEQVAGVISNDDVLDALKMQNLNVEALVKLFADGHKLEERKTRISHELKIAKEEKAKIKPGIEQNNITIDSFGTIDEKAINKEIERLNKEIEKIDETIADKSKADDAISEGLREKRAELNKLKDLISDSERQHEIDFRRETMEHSAGKEELQNNVTSLRSKKQSKESLVSELEMQEKTLVEQLQGLTNKFKDENAKDFPEWDKSNFGCDKCKRPFEQTNIDAKIEELENAFIEDKKTALKAIKESGERGQNLLKEKRELILSEKNALETIVSDLAFAESNLRDKIAEIEAKEGVKTVFERIQKDVSINANLEKIKSIEADLANVKPNDYTELKNKRSEFFTLVSTETSRLTSKQTIVNLKKRNEDLAEKEKTLAAQIAKLQQEEILIGQFTISRMDLVKKSVENLFEYVTFKMFDTNVTTGENVPFCELWIDGKPFSACNNALQVNAGLDVINALSKHYGVYIPILIDNAEGVQSFIDVESQLITLTVGQGVTDELGLPTGKLLITHK